MIKLFLMCLVFVGTLVTCHVVAPTFFSHTVFSVLGFGVTWAVIAGWVAMYATYKA